MKRVLLSLCVLALALPSAASAKRQVIPYTNDWQTAVSLVQKAYPGSKQWLLDCSSSEGGHGPWVWRGGDPLRLSQSGRVLNDHGNVPGGPGQYFRSTFWHDYSAAIKDLLGRGFLVPSGTSDWFSVEGQAIAMSWAYSHDRPRGKWTGSRC